MKWETSVDDIPQGLSPEEMKNWLWRRAKPNRPGEMADLRNQTTFPNLLQLPNAKSFNAEYFVPSDGAPYVPRRHWLFLAEVDLAVAPKRLQKMVKDFDDKLVPLIKAIRYVVIYYVFIHCMRESYLAL